MNVLENYIEEIHSEVSYIKDPKFIKVDITTNCYGPIKRDVNLFNVEE